MGFPRGLASLIVLITLSFCFHDVDGSNCTMRVMNMSTKISCPLSLDDPDKIYCCGEPTDMLGQNCCTAEEYFRDGKDEGKGFWLAHNVITLVLLIVLVVMAISAMILCYICPRCLLFKRRHSTVISDTASGAKVPSSPV